MSDNDRERTHYHSVQRSNAATQNAPMAPGRVSEASRLSPRNGAYQNCTFTAEAVQRYASGEANNDDVHAAAHAGIAGPGGALPHGDAIQRSFGRHDISGVRAHVGGEAATASAAMGARAYATGNNVAFAQQPDLHLAAHEAAHVVQQRVGVQLSSGVGQVGDPYELHADAVADRVVQGESAEALLDTMAGSGGSPAVQRDGEDAGVSRDRTSSRGRTSSSDRTSGGDRTSGSDRTSDVDRTSGGGGRTSGGGGVRLSTNLEQFTINFNREFAAQLHVFADRSSEPTAEGGRDVRTTADAATTASGTGVTQETLAYLFTAAQIDMLDAFCSDHVIPERLFNGDERGHTTAQQRILLSGHILSVGHYSEAEFDQRVHARMCGHWVNLVYSYAGVGEGMGLGVREQFDHTGGLVMSVEDRTGPDGSVGIGRGHRDALGGELGLGSRAGRRAPQHAGARSDWQDAGLPIEQFEMLQPGDWLYVYNDCGPQGGNHSVVFSRWASGWLDSQGRPADSEEQRFGRRAVTMSQIHPDAGGREEVRWLGRDYVTIPGGGHFTPITRISRPDATARPMQTVEDLITILGSGDEAVANFRFVQRLTHGRGEFDWAALAQHLRERNDELISQLAPHMTSNQEQVFRDTNALHPPAGEESTSAEGEIPLLVRLHQRLRILVQDASVLDDASRTQRQRLIATHDASLEATEDERARLQARITPLEAEIRRLEQDQAPIEAQVEQYAEHTAALHALIRERRTLRARRTELRTAMQTTSHTPEQVAAITTELGAIGPRLTQLQTDINRLQDEEDATRSDRRAAQRADRQGDARIHRDTMQIAELRTRIARLEAQAGYFTAHGRVGGDTFQGRGQGGTVNGRLQELQPAPNWQLFIRPATAGASAPPITTTLH